MSELKEKWDSLDTFREVKSVSNGKVLVIRQKERDMITPLFCSFCNFPMKSSEDSTAYRKHGCCGSCSLFCRGDRNAISSEVWDEYINTRHLLGKPLFIFK